MSEQTEKIYIQQVTTSKHGKLDVIACNKQGTMKYFYNDVCPNIVRCMLGRDFDYFSTRRLIRDGRDNSRQLGEDEIADLLKYSG